MREKSDGRHSPVRRSARIGSCAEELEVFFQKWAVKKIGKRFFHMILVDSWKELQA